VNDDGRKLTVKAVGRSDERSTINERALMLKKVFSAQRG
jgi:hypothetical protein